MVYDFRYVPPPPFCEGCYGLRFLHPSTPSPLLHSFSHSLALLSLFSANHKIRVSHPHCAPSAVFSQCFGPHGEDGAEEKA